MKKSTVGHLMFVFLIVVLCSCRLPHDSLDDGPSGGSDSGARGASLTVDITTVGVKTLIPGIDMNPASFVVSGAGPEGSSFSVDTAGSAVTISDLEFGDWIVSVDAKNASGTVIAQGGTNTILHSGESQNLAIVVRPLDGFGTLDLDVLWNDGDVEVPSVQADLVLSTGATVNLDFTVVAPGQASFSSDAILTGYHSLSVKLLDNGTQVMGGVEIVRIVKDQTTSGAFEFYEINQAGGTIEVNVTPELQDPIVVTIAGAADTLIEGEQMALTASAPSETGTVLYTWYLNGDAVATGSTFAVGGSLAVGIYRIDVTAFSPDGGRAGSARHEFTVSEGAQVSLAWDPNTESDLAGYRLYYGVASRDYSTCIDVGNRTAYDISGLAPGQTYYVAATAYNSGGLESDYSDELVFQASM